MTAHVLLSRLTTLSEGNKTNLQLVQRLSKLSSPHDSFSSDGKDEVQAELSSDISENLKQQEEEFELIKQEFEWLESGIANWARKKDSERDREWTRLSLQSAKLEEDLKL